MLGATRGLRMLVHSLGARAAPHQLSGGRVDEIDRERSADSFIDVHRSPRIPESKVVDVSGSLPTPVRAPPCGRHVVSAPGRTVEVVLRLERATSHDVEVRVVVVAGPASTFELCGDRDVGVLVDESAVVGAVAVNGGGRRRKTLEGEGPRTRKVELLPEVVAVLLRCRQSGGKRSSSNHEADHRASDRSHRTSTRSYAFLPDTSALVKSARRLPSD